MELGGGREPNTDSHMGGSPGEAEARDVDPEAAPGVPGGVPGVLDAAPGAPGGPAADPGGVIPPGDPAVPGDPEADVGDPVPDAPGAAPEGAKGDVEEALRPGVGAPGVGIWGVKPGEGGEGDDIGGRGGPEEAAGSKDAPRALEVEGLREAA